MSQSNESPVEKALEKAREELREALHKQAAGGDDSLEEEENTTRTPPTAAASPDPNDPDALAAAFFAKQAQQQALQTKLPTKEWAAILKSSDWSRLHHQKLFECMHEWIIVEKDVLEFPRDSYGSVEQNRTSPYGYFW